MGAASPLIERDMLKGPWVMGEQYTVCDPYLLSLVGWLEGDSVDIATLPKIADHRKRMEAAPRCEGAGEERAEFVGWV